MKLIWDREAGGESTSRLTDDGNNELMTVHEAAASIRVSEETIRWWMRNGYIPFVPVGAFKMIRKSDLHGEDAADGMPTARPRTNGEDHGSDTVRAADAKQPEPVAPAAEAKARGNPQRQGGTGPGERHKGRR